MANTAFSRAGQMVEQQVVDLFKDDSLTYQQMADRVGVSLSFVMKTRKAWNFPNRERGRRRKQTRSVTEHPLGHINQ